MTEQRHIYLQRHIYDRASPAELCTPESYFESKLQRVVFDGLRRENAVKTRPEWLMKRKTRFFQFALGIFTMNILLIYQQEMFHYTMCLLGKNKI
jgi:hypothetical protein